MIYLGKIMLNKILLNHPRISIGLISIIISVLLTITLLKHDISFSGIWGGIIGGCISGLVTFMAMSYIDDKNHQRWQKATLQNKKTELMVEAIISLANCLNYIELKKLNDIQSGIFLPFYESDLDKFRNCFSNLSQYLIFIPDNCNEYTSIKEVKNLTEIITQIFRLILFIKNEPSQSLHPLIEKNILYFNEKYIFYVDFIRFVDYFSNSTNLHEFHIGYGFHSEFKRDYDNDFIKLVNTFYEKAGKIHILLKNDCTIDN